MHVVLIVVLAFVVIRHERPKVIPTTLQMRSIRPVSTNVAKSGRSDCRLFRSKFRKPSRSKIARRQVDEKGLGGKTRRRSRSAGQQPDGKSTSPGRWGDAASAVPSGHERRGQPADVANCSRRKGGTEKTEQAVSQGLSWLSRQQKPDGHWELHQGYPDAGQLRTTTGATALSLLTFLGAGHTHQDGPYKEKVGKGLRWLQGVQKKGGALKGDFYDLDREGDAASFYSHGQATIALCEAYALTRDQELLPAIQDGLAFIYDAQHPTTGGWKYRRRSEGDLSVFGWQIMALQSARMAGLEVPRDVLDRAAQFLDLVQEQGGARYRYEPNEMKSFSPAMTAEGLLCRQYLGWPRTHPAMKSGVKYLLEPENMPDWNSRRRNIYHWYYASQVMHNLQGSDWETWNTALREELVKYQLKGGGKIGGSWNPFQPAGAIDENADKGGRLYVTCLCLLTLEVYYRHLPLYREQP